MSLTVLGITSQAFHRKSLYWNLMFPQDKIRVILPWRKTTDVNCHSHNIISRVHIISMVHNTHVDTDIVHQDEVLFIRLLH